MRRAVRLAARGPACQRFVIRDLLRMPGISDLVAWQGLSGRMATMSSSSQAKHAAMKRRESFGGNAVTAMSMKWTAIHDAASAVSGLAGLSQEFRTAEVRNFPAIMRDTGGWRQSVAEQGVDDLAAIMRPGLAALLALQTDGVLTTAAATALWQEFLAARAALLALVPPLGNVR